MCKGTVSRDGYGFWWHVWLVLGPKKSKRTLTARNTLLQYKIIGAPKNCKKNWPRPPFLGLELTIQKPPNPSRGTVPLILNAGWCRRWGGQFASVAPADSGAIRPPPSRSSSMAVNFRCAAMPQLLFSVFRILILNFVEVLMSIAPPRHMLETYEVHPKSNEKMWIKRAWLQLGNYFFVEFLKESIADLITLLFSSLQNSECGGNEDSGDSCADPCQFLPFPKTKI